MTQNSTTNPILTPNQEGLVVQLLEEAKELIILVENHFPSKESYYLMESLFLVLRQMGYFFTERSSPIFSYGSSFSQGDKDVLEKIKDIRDGIGHRESPNNFLTLGIKLVGGKIFKNDDVEIQYGKNKLYLVKDILAIHKKLRYLFSSVTELSFLTKGYNWNIQEKELQEAETRLIENLKNPKKLLGLDKR